MADGPYLPHPQVLELAEALTTIDGTPSTAGEALALARQELADSATAENQQQVSDAQLRVHAAEIALVDEIANDPTLPELNTFGGFLGGTLEDDTNTTPTTTWQLLYLDAKLRTWLLVDQNSILLLRRLTDDTSPFGTRDYIWVKADTSVSQGEGPPQKHEVQARFLRGDFVSAGDFAASFTGGGTFAPPTGPMCTPGCCGKRTK
jgi:hypothetical protein